MLLGATNGDPQLMVWTPRVIHVSDWQPRPGCWEMVSSSHNGGLDVEKAACLYVGDAAGRPKQGTHKKVKPTINRGLHAKCCGETANGFHASQSRETPWKWVSISSG